MTYTIINKQLSFVYGICMRFLLFKHLKPRSDFKQSAYMQTPTNSTVELSGKDPNYRTFRPETSPFYTVTQLYMCFTKISSSWAFI